MSAFVPTAPAALAPAAVPGRAAAYADSPPAGWPNATPAGAPSLGWASHDGSQPAAPPPPWRVPREYRAASAWQRHGTLASWWRRVLAMVVDTVALAVPIAAVAAWLLHTDRTGKPWPTPGKLSFAALEVLPDRVEVGLAAGGLALVVVYFTLCNGLGRGSTLGGALGRVAVRRRSSGEALGLGRSLERCLVRLVLYAGLVVLALQTADRPWWVLACCAAPGVMNDLRPLWNRRRLSFADTVAGSVVIIPRRAH